LGPILDVGGLVSDGDDVGDGEWGSVDDDDHVPAPLVTIETRRTSLPRHAANPGSVLIRFGAVGSQNDEGGTAPHSAGSTAPHTGSRTQGFTAPRFRGLSAPSYGVENPGCRGLESVGEAARFAFAEADPNLQQLELLVAYFSPPLIG
jgi:hypothetical protein